MSFAQDIKRVSLAMLGDEVTNIRQIILPATGLGAGAGIGATATSGAALTWGVWIDVALPAAVLANSLIYGIALDTPSGAEVFTVDIGSAQGYANAAAVIAAGVAAVAAAHRQEIRVEIATDAGGYLFIPLPIPIFIPNGTGILARCSSVSGADTINVSVACVQGY